MEGTLTMEFEVTITLADSREDPDFGEALLEGFLLVSPGCDVVVSQDSADEEATVWLLLPADDAASAGQTAIAALRNIETPQPLVPTAIHVAAATEPAPQAA
jgi:hypothetical protein